MEKSARKQPETVDEYIAAQPEALRPGLQEIRQVIRQVVPDVEELISYQMPGYRYHGKLIWFAGNKKHYGIYIEPVFLKVFSERLSAYGQTKSAIQIPIDKPIPTQILTEIVQYIAQKNREQQATKKQ